MKTVVSLITLYRLISAPVLLGLLFAGHFEWFKWLIALSYMTDAIDGTLARKFHVTSTLGARLDSMADDATVFVSAIGLYKIRPEFFMEHFLIIILLIGLYVAQNTMAYIAYKRATSFHTILAKISAVLQGVFFIIIFFGSAFAEFLFYPAVIFTVVELVEEMIMIAILPEWRANVKGLYWLLRDKNVGHRAP